MRILTITTMILFSLIWVSIVFADTESGEKKYSFEIDQKEENDPDEPSLDEGTQELFDKAIRLFDMKDYDDSIGWLNKVLAEYPEYIPALHKKGLAYIEKGRISKSKKDVDDYSYDKHIFEFRKAVEVFGKLIELDPGISKAYLYRGISYRELEYYPQPAIDDLTEYIEKFEIESSQAYCERGMAYTQRGFIPEAIKDHQKAIGLDPGNTTAYTYLVKDYFILKKFDEAIEYFSQLIQEYPDNANPFYGRGLAYLQKKDYERAIRDFQKALQIYPDHEDAHSMYMKAIEQSIR